MRVEKQKDASEEEERKPGEETTVKAEELRNATRIWTSLACLPTVMQGLREWVRAGEGIWRRKNERFVIF